MNLLITEVQPRDRHWDDGGELAICKVSYDEPEWSNLKSTRKHNETQRAMLYAQFAEKLRAQLRLDADQRQGIQKWLHASAVGDTLIINGDQISITKLPYTDSTVSRMEVKKVEVVKVEVVVKTLPANTKKVKPASKKKQ